MVSGHDWEFDGLATRIAPQERWLNETKEWANKITFDNNPFNYTHFEENYVSNPKVKIIHDYGIKFPPKDYVESPYLKERMMATFTLDYNKVK